MVSEVGTPWISNNFDIHWAHHPKTNSHTHAGLFKAIKEVHYVLIDAQTNCSLKKHCSMIPSGDLTCDHCDNSPWGMTKNKDLCAFAQIWNLWGLEGKTPILRK